VYANVDLRTNIEDDFNDVQVGALYDAHTGLSVVTLWERWNHQGTAEGEYDEIRVRVEGLLDVTDSVDLAIATQYGPSGLNETTIYDTDKLTFACMPLVHTELHRTYVPIVVNNHD
jgi:hypothetical protein